MLDSNIIFKPGVGLVDRLTGRITHPKAFGVEGYGVFDFKSGVLLIAERDLRNRVGSALPFQDTLNPYNKFISFQGLSQVETPEYRRPKIELTPVDSSGVLSDVDPKEEELEVRLGMLIQPYTLMIWGGQAVDPKWYRNIQWTWGEDGNPGGLSFSLDPMAPFANFPIGTDGEGSEILVEFGYNEKRAIRGWFIHTATSFMSGNDMSVSIEASHSSFRADQTSARNRYFSSSKSAIKFFPHLERIAEPYNLKFDTQVEDTDKYEFWTSSQAETDMRYLLRNTQSMGVSVGYTFSKDNDIIFKPMGITKRKQPKIAKPEGLVNQKETEVFYLGPGLITSISRKVVATKLSSPPPKNKEATESNATTDINRPTEKDPLNLKEILIDKIGSNNRVIVGDEEKRFKREFVAQGSGERVGSPATPNKPLSKNESKDSESKDNKLEKEANDNKKEKLETGSIQMDTSFFMVPRLCGIKPGDVVVIMFMEKEDAVYQDFLISDVSYQQEGASYQVSVSGSRWLKNKPMILNWTEVLEDMQGRGLFNGFGESHGEKLYGEITEHYPMYESWISYYWGT